MHRSLLPLLPALLAVACGGSPDASADGGLASDAAPAADAYTIPGLGDSCATGCAGSDVCANESESCETGWCLFDARDEPWQSYCTADCEAVPCPAGYACEDVPFSLTRACVAEPAVCGDGTVQRGEACDDGNTDSDDGCRGDCAAVDTPLSEQHRMSIDMALTGEHRPDEGGELEPFAIDLAFAGQIGAPGDGCEEPRLAVGGGTESYSIYWAESCGAGGWARLTLPVPFSEGVSTPNAVCAAFSIPHPNGDPLGAMVEYCANPNDATVVVGEVTGGPAGGGARNVSGSMTAVLTLRRNEAIGGCDGLYGPNDCPDIEGTVTLSGDFAVQNAGQ